MTIKVTYQKKFQTFKLEKGASTYWYTKSRAETLFLFLKLLSDDQFEGGESKITFCLYSMKIKEQTRKLAAGCTWVRQGDVDVVWIWFSKSITLLSCIAFLDMLQLW